MKLFTSKKSIQKIIISIIVVILLNFCIPMNSYSANWDDVGGKLLKEVMQFVIAIGDAVVGGLNYFMLGTEDFGSAMIDKSTLEYNIEDHNTVFYAGAEEVDVYIENGEMDKKGIGDIKDYEYPNMLYSPENIFANKIAMLDVNFLQPNQYTSVTTGQEVTYDENADLKDQDQQVSAAAFLSSTIATWYRSFRNISIVGLLTVLVYIGIKILISSTAVDKAKYKEGLRDWFVALCLVFVIHIIMAGILMLVDQVNNLIAPTANNIVVYDEGVDLKFKTNLMGLIRFKAQAEAWQEAVSYSLIYLVLIIYTIIFTFQYLKRFLWMAFFTMIAPLVALTYPIDRAGDGKAQAFNLWFKEYTMNAIIQPIHLLLYTALVSTSVSLTVKNPIYALVAIGFMIPAEKFIKKMFGINAETTSGMGSFAGGALAMSGLQKLANAGKNKGGSSEKSNSVEDSQDGNINFAKDTSGGDFDGFANGALPQGDNANEAQEIIAQDDKHQRMLDDRAEWERMANDERASDLDRQEAQEQVDIINEDMRQAGYLPSNDEKKDDNKQDDKPETIKGTNTSNNQSETSEETNTSNNQPRPEEGWRRRYLKSRITKGAPKVYKGAKKVARGMAKVAGATAGASIGLAAGIATGDASKAFTYSAAGAVAGSAIGNNTANFAGAIGKGLESIPGKFEKRDNEIQYMKDEAQYGAAVARQMKIDKQNEKATAEFLKNKDEQKKWEDVRGKLTGYTGTTEDLMNVVADYKKADPKMDDKIIENALKLETKYGDKKIGGSAHQQIVDVAKFTTKNGYGREYVEDKEKRQALDSHIDSKVQNEKVRNQIKKMHAELNDVGHLRK